MTVFSAVRLGAAAALKRALSAAVWFVLLGLAGAILLVAGVYVLAGVGASMVAAGAVCVAIAGLLLVGMTRGE